MVAFKAVTKQTFNVLLRDIHEILQMEVNFMVMSHNRYVKIISILQASQCGIRMWQYAIEASCTCGGVRLTERELL